MYDYYNKSIETMKPKKLAHLQTKRLRAILKYAYKNSPKYRQKFDAANVNIDKIKSLDDIKKLPLTEKYELPIKDNNDLMSAPLNKIAETHQSSGSTGNPIKIRYTLNDLKQLAEMNARCLYTAGIRAGDGVQNAYTYGMFTGGMGIHYGTLALGAGIIPTSTGNTKEQINIMRCEKPKALACTASYAYRLWQETQTLGLAPKDISWQVALFGAEPCSDGKRKDIEDKLGLEAYDLYGLSEMGGPGVAVECGCKAGLHIWSDLFYPEIMAKDGEIADEGEEGELLLTTLSREAMPLIRYNTHDITSISYEKCACGRTMPTISKIRRRDDNMLIINGINVYPIQVEKTLQRLAGEIPIMSSEYQMRIFSKGPADKLEIRIGLGELKDNIDKMRSWENIITDEMKSTLKITPCIHLVNLCDLYSDETAAKAKKIVDLRTTYATEYISQNTGRGSR